MPPARIVTPPPDRPENDTGRLTKTVSCRLPGAHSNTFLCRPTVAIQFIRLHAARAPSNAKHPIFLRTRPSGLDSELSASARLSQNLRRVNSGDCSHRSQKTKKHSRERFTPDYCMENHGSSLSAPYPFQNSCKDVQNPLRQKPKVSSFTDKVASSLRSFPDKIYKESHPISGGFRLHAVLWEHRDSNPGPSACKADALNQLSYTPSWCN